MKRKKWILAGLLVAFLSLFSLISFTTIVGGIYEEYAAMWKETSSDVEGEGVIDDEIQAGVVKGKRTAYPSQDNPFFFSAKYNPFVGTPSGPPLLTHNCTWYAFGRFSEILGKKALLPTTDAGMWFDLCTAYKKGRTPKVGAVVCWKYYPYGAGHVAVVEEVKANGDIVTSNSGYHGANFWMETWRAAGNYSNGKFRFQGFIYQP